jgi:hypothetical protein
MREIRKSGSEGGGAGNSTGPPYPYRARAPPGHPISLTDSRDFRRTTLASRALPTLCDRGGLSAMFETQKRPWMLRRPSAYAAA